MKQEAAVAPNDSRSRHSMSSEGDERDHSRQVMDEQDESESHRLTMNGSDALDDDLASIYKCNCVEG